MIDISQASVVLTVLSILTAVLLLGGSLAFFGVFVQRQFPPEAKKEEEPTIDPSVLAKRSAAYRLGFLVLFGLAVLTLIEYLLGISWPSVVLLMVMGLFKAGLIVQYFMHVTRIWSEEGH